MKKEVLVQMRITKDLKERAMEHAEELGLNLSAYIRFLLIKDLEKNN